MKPLKLLILIIFLHVTLSAKVIDLNNIANLALQENKQIMIFFNMTYCGACRKMKNNVLDDTIVKRKISKDFIFVDMNINDDEIVLYNGFKGKIRNFARKFNIFFYPHIIFMGVDKNVKHHLKGYRDKEKLLTVIEYIGTRSYEKMDLDSFISEKEFNE